MSTSDLDGRPDRTPREDGRAQNLDGIATLPISRISLMGAERTSESRTARLVLVSLVQFLCACVELGDSEQSDVEVIHSPTAGRNGIEPKSSSKIAAKTKINLSCDRYSIERQLPVVRTQKVGDSSCSFGLSSGFYVASLSSE